MLKAKSKSHQTCPMIARSDWGVGHVQQRGLTHAISLGQSTVGFHGPKIAGWLVFLNGCHRGEDMRLPVGSTSIGSAWTNDHVITGVGVGSQHAVIQMAADGATIAPLAQDKLVKIDNVTTHQRAPLIDGCLVTIGDCHAIFRVADQMNRGYHPNDAPKPLNAPVQAALNETVCGWLVITRGSFYGQDFRLTNGLCRIGSMSGLEVSIPDQNLAKHVLTLLIGPKEAKVSWYSDEQKIAVNGLKVTHQTIVKESDSLVIDHVEGYFKWLRP